MTSDIFLLAFLIGFVDGLRSLTAPAVVAWASNRNWLQLNGTALSFMASSAAVVIFTLLAVAELIADKLPSTPSRLGFTGLSARIAFGGLSGACLAAAGAKSIAPGVGLGVAGGVAGAITGYETRRHFVKTLRVPDWVIAVCEDAVAIGSGLLIVTRF